MRLAHVEGRGAGRDVWRRLRAPICRHGWDQTGTHLTLGIDLCEIPLRVILLSMKVDHLHFEPRRCFGIQRLAENKSETRHERVQRKGEVVQRVHRGGFVRHRELASRSRCSETNAGTVVFESQVEVNSRGRRS